MPALKPTSFFADIRWLGRVPDGPDLPSIPLSEMALSFDGLAGEKHAGRTRPSCSRVTRQHARGTQIANVRQICIVSEEELQSIAHAIGLDRITPEWLGASIVVSGLPEFTYVPPSSRLQGPDGCTLVVDMENRPCHLPGREIEKQHPGLGKRFKEAAQGRRGVTAWVERPGILRCGDRLRLHVPDQPAWSHLDTARAP